MAAAFVEWVGFRRFRFANRGLGYHGSIWLLHLNYDICLHMIGDGHIKHFDTVCHDGFFSLQLILKWDNVQG